MKCLYQELLEATENNRLLALATIVATSSSTPQIPGASALFTADGLLTGTLGGGVMEGDAEKRAVQCINDRTSSFYEYELNADIATTECAICGGTATILLDAQPENHAGAFRQLSQSIARRQPGVLATVCSFRAGQLTSIARHWLEADEDNFANLAAPFDACREELAHALKAGRPRFVQSAPAEKGEKLAFFFEPVCPLPQLLIAGAGHIGQALSRLGAMLDFEVTVIDDRPEWANGEKLPDADQLIVRDIGQAMQEAVIHPNTYVVIVTRGHHDDAAALKQCIGSSAAYIGMIGSKRKIELMRSTFLEQGRATSAQFDRVFAPIGLSINSKTVQEIAVSIAAELIDVRYHKQHQEAGAR